MARRTRTQVAEDIVNDAFVFVRKARQGGCVNKVDERILWDTAAGLGYLTDEDQFSMRTVKRLVRERAELMGETHLLSPELGGPTELSRKQAEAVLKEIEKRWKWHLEGLPADSPDRPQLRENWMPYWRNDGEDGEPVPFAIIWESGPDEWAYRFTMGGVDGEMYELTAALGDEDFARKLATEEPAADLKGVYSEPGTSFILCLYPA